MDRAGLSHRQGQEAEFWSSRRGWAIDRQGLSPSRSHDRVPTTAAPPTVNLLIRLVSASMFLAGAVLSYRAPRATAPCYIVGSLVMLSGIVHDAWPALLRAGTGRRATGWAVAVGAVAAIIACSAFAVGTRLRFVW